ncbi:MAG TPA: class I SAM-dependent rRNA methyltransferase [Kiritimatiellia bacterium]|nr:class I SAM-dependent rRNA methyltransferase [Kiritimatiellia bacterium]
MTSVHATLKPGRERLLRQGHPWVFTGAVASWSRTPKPGDTVDILSSQQEWIGRGLAGTGSNLAIRIYTHHPDQPLDAPFFTHALHTAIAFRESVIIPHEPHTDSFRLCYSESDHLSGLIVDQYADHAVLQLHTSLLLPYVPTWLDLLHTRGLATTVLYDAPSFQREGIDPPPPSSSHPRPDPILIRENDLRFHVSLHNAQKTGFYLDQRVNRRRVAAYAAGRHVLDAFSYTGAFSLACARAGAASVTGIDRSEPALDHARVHAGLNPAPIEPIFLCADVGEQLRRYRDARKTFGMIILDPPKFVHHQAQLEKGLRAYKDINRLALALLEPGGFLATFSCSGWVKTDTFQTAVQWAAQDAGRPATLLERLGQPPDHPIPLAFPESDYLCGLILRATP